MEIGIFTVKNSKIKLPNHHNQIRQRECFKHQNIYKLVYLVYSAIFTEKKYLKLNLSVIEIMAQILSGLFQQLKITRPMAKKGNINVQTENIFPIIKQFLYSDHEIFLRELVSNAVDATQKVKTLKSIGKLKADIDKLRVEVIIDKKKETITIRDNGIGMTEEEVDKYINQIAFSGAEEFVNKYKDVDAKNSIIGHFGLGFYSSFMVSKEVEIITKSQKANSTAVKWICDGSPNYTIEETTKKTKGTDIILHIDNDSKEFLEGKQTK